MPWLVPAVAPAIHAPNSQQPPADQAKALVKVSALARDAKVKPGDTTHVAVVLDVEKGWHLYWPGQSDSGTPVAVILSFPGDSGLTAGAVSYPLPSRLLLSGDILDYVLEGKVVLTVPVNVPASATIGRRIKVAAAVQYLVCHESCIPGEDRASATIEVAEKTEPAEANAKLIDDARAAQPRPQSDGFDTAAAAAWDGPDTLVITAKAPGVTKATFYPAADGAKLLDPVKTGQTSGPALRLRFAPGLKPADGVVELRSGNTVQAWSFRMPRPAGPGGPAAPPAATGSPTGKPKG
ncbi:MAG: hypothetical protein K2Q09_08250 [Phycisphaerales bacterium]|nr:hypothetical protein [Phycisphaerales bacterium]